MIVLRFQADFRPNNVSLKWIMCVVDAQLVKYFNLEDVYFQ